MLTIAIENGWHTIRFGFYENARPRTLRHIVDIVCECIHFQDSTPKYTNARYHQMQKSSHIKIPFQKVNNEHMSAIFRSQFYDYLFHAIKKSRFSSPQFICHRFFFSIFLLLSVAFMYFIGIYGRQGTESAANAVMVFYIFEQ